MSSVPKKVDKLNLSIPRQYQMKANVKDHKKFIK